MLKKHSWLLLIPGAILYIFSNGRYAFAPAAWFAPLFMLSYTRTVKPFKGYIITAVLLGLSSQLAFWKFSSSNPYNPLFYLPFLLGFLFALPYTLDRLLFKKYKGVLETLIFPLAYTAAELLYVSLSPMGSTGTLAYSQTGFTVFNQIASITGIYGLTFIIVWFSSAVSGAINSDSSRNRIRTVTIYASVLLLVFGFGFVRLILNKSSGTVRVSGLHTFDLRSELVQNTWDEAAAHPDEFKEMTDIIFSDLIEGTKREAANGSKIIVWSEISPLMLSSSQDEYMSVIKQTAIDSKVFIVACPYILSSDFIGKDINKLLIFNPEGQIILEHYKYGGAFLDNIIEGDKKLKAVDTIYGRLTGAICWDADFPLVMRQLGLLKSDLLLIPTADWKEISPIHGANAYFRGIENGVSVFRQTVNGLSFASDAYGRIVAKMNHYETDNWVLTAEIPVHKVFTLYPIIGDNFAYLCCLALLFLCLYKPKHKNIIR